MSRKERHRATGKEGVSRNGKQNSNHIISKDEVKRVFLRQQRVTTTSHKCSAPAE
jgi:hypothetical protein